jgi:hypothetical protein
VTAVAHNGEVRWSADAVCRPLPVARTHAVLCFHDDDAEPETAFEMLDWKTGAKLASYPVRDDVLNLKLSQDERHFAISFSGGRVMLFELIEPKPGFKQVWDRKFRSEVLDLSVSSGLVGVLTADQKLQLLDFAGKTRAEAALGARVEQIELAPQGGGVMAFDNSARGQTLMYFDLPADLPSDTLKLEEKWRKQDPEPSNYTAPLLVSEGQVMLRFESSDERSMKSRLFSFSADGHAAWSLPLEHGEGSQLYAQTRIGDTDWVYVATDDGEIRAYAPARRGDGAGK